MFLTVPERTSCDRYNLRHDDVLICVDLLSICAAPQASMLASWCMFVSNFPMVNEY